MKACRNLHMSKMFMILFKPGKEDHRPMSIWQKDSGLSQVPVASHPLKDWSDTSFLRVILSPCHLGALEFSSKITVSQIPISHPPLSHPPAICLCSKNTNGSPSLDGVRICANLYVYTIWLPSFPHKLLIYLKAKLIPENFCELLYWIIGCHAIFYQFHVS